MQSLAFGGEQYERLEIAVLGYERPAAGDFSDDNWLRVKVAIHCGAFQGEFLATFLTSDFESFREQLSSLYETLKGEAEFQTIEEQLSFSITGNGMGHMLLRGSALDQAGIGNRLAFTLNLDQSQLYSSLQSLGAIISAYPVRT